MNGHEVRPPRYYDSMRDEKEMERVKGRRKARALRHAQDQTGERLRVRERVKEAQVSRLVRSI